MNNLKLQQCLLWSEKYTDEEKAFLKKLTQEPTSLSADLVPRSNSFVSNYVPKPVDVNQAR
jgi:hypothetical protein